VDVVQALAVLRHSQTHFPQRGTASILQPVGILGPFNNFRQATKAPSLHPFKYVSHHPMSIFKHYLQTAASLINAYTGSMPLHHFLKQFFSSHKKYGSRDRKFIASLCYNYYRLGKALVSLPVDEKIVTALFICSKHPVALLADTNPGFNEKVGIPLNEKLAISGISEREIFPYGDSLSNPLRVDAYAIHMLNQPDVFIRIRPGKEKVIHDELNALQWNYVLESYNSVRLEAGLPVDKNLKINQDIIIQDLNSQKVGSIIKEVFDQNNFKPYELWDCCAASGGKSLMINDLFPGVKITVSDIRQSILQNLSKRFKEAGIFKFRSFLADLASGQKIPIKPVSFLIADVPCTGSGTWSRTPEQLFFFKEELIKQYAEKQFAIATNALKYLLPGGWFIYITCSVFAQENDNLIARLLKNDNLNLVQEQVLDGTGIRADSMYVAILRLKV
jgi:16S rRNA (cytosine967-C5)-methyltransferase